MRASSVAVGLIVTTVILAALAYLKRFDQPLSPNAHPFPFDP
jgi:hypothetical protein